MLKTIHSVKTGFDPVQCFDDLVLSGCYMFHEPNIAQSIDLARGDWRPQKESTKFEWAPGNSYLASVFDQYEEKHLSKVWGKLERVNYWYCNGVEDSSAPWHTDLLENIDISMLCYLSDMSPDVAGYIAVRNTTTGEGVMLYPKLGDVVILHHAEGFEHRAEPALVDRFYINITYRTEFWENHAFPSV